MPELPEVETIRNVLKPIVIGRKITSIDVLRKSTIVGEATTFVDTLKNETFLDITRIGKFLIFHLTNNKVFISHLRMEGKYFDYLENEPDSKYARVVFHFDNNHKLCYDDSRCFGMMKLSNESSFLKEKEISKLGPEPFFIHDETYLYNKYKRINKPIKSVLLDQEIMTGLGNIYVDEVLFSTHIHPLTPAKMLTKEDCKNIIKESQRILNRAIKEGGSTIRSYHPGKDIDGNFQTLLLAYGHKDEPCPNCGHIMRFKKVGGRGSTYCPICQKKLGAPLKVAIYGKIASGKSTVLEEFASLGLPTISSDKIVHDLYQKKEVINKINEMFNFKGDELDLSLLRETVASDYKKAKKLERYIHPLVKKELIRFMEENKEISICEVPLLYESKMDDLFDYIIAVDINEKNQKERLMSRDPLYYEKMMKINQSSKFDDNKNKADYIIHNDFDIKTLKKEIKGIFNTLQSRLK